LASENAVIDTACFHENINWMESQRHNHFYSLRTVTDKLMKQHLYGRPNRPHYGSSPFVCPSVRLAWFPNSKFENEKAQKSPNWCESFPGRNN